jgi:putative hydrolase
MQSGYIQPAQTELPLGNQEVAETLDEIADLLEQQGANPFRVNAYRVGADQVRRLSQSVLRIVEVEGLHGLTALRGIGKSLARSIDQLARTGRLPLLERLRGNHAAESIFSTVPNIGPELARRIHEQLHIESLGELEAAALDGRLAQVPGMGRKRLRAVRESLAGRFRRRPDRQSVDTPQPQDDVPVEELLDIDAQYLRLVDQGQLPLIAPRRFNPTGEAWLPVLHTQRHDRHYTALFSNTARAHELGTTHDWVVIYRDDPQADGRWTVITSQFGKLQGRRIVRGREAQCAAYYADQHAIAGHRPSSDDRPRDAEAAR